MVYNPVKKANSFVKTKAKGYASQEHYITLALENFKKIGFEYEKQKQDALSEINSEGALKKSANRATEIQVSSVSIQDKINQLKETKGALFTQLEDNKPSRTTRSTPPKLLPEALTPKTGMTAQKELLKKRPSGPAGA